MAKGSSGGEGILELGAVILFKVAPLVAGIILGLQLLPNSPFQISNFISIASMFFIYILLIIAILSTLEARSIQKKGGGSISGASFAFWVAMIIALIGFGFVGFILATGYTYQDTFVNQWLAIYLFLGATLIFINSREQIFFSKAILKALN